MNTRDLERCIDDYSASDPLSGVIHLTRGDKVLFERASGSAIKSHSIPNTINTRFQTASGSKIFTSVAICQLVERGKLEFDSLLGEVIDERFPNFDPNITIHQLLMHSSGITSYFEEDINPDYEALWRDVPMYKIRKPRDFLPLFQTKAMKFAPGERFDYNDGGYILLGVVIERVTGMSFSEYIQANVFRPAGMTDSGYFTTDQLPERTAYAYIKNEDGGWRTNFFAVPIVGAPDGGAYTTAPDMLRFWKALAGSEILSSETTSLLLDPHIKATPGEPGTHYGYGVWIDMHNAAVRAYSVVGFDPGVTMQSAFYPSEGIVLTVLSNTGNAVWRLCGEIEKLLYQEMDRDSV
jgi:CubicO group peptidase (beta-lactamase class C family)